MDGKAMIACMSRRLPTGFAARSGQNGFDAGRVALRRLEPWLNALN